jgi:ketosteroid isomerase-like protein
MAVTDEIKAANGRFVECFRRRDADGIAALYAGGAKLLPPRSNFVQGRQAIRDLWRNVMERGVEEAALETLEVEAYADTAIEVGTYVMRAGGQVVDRGKYVVIWKNENGAWKLHRDIWNSSVATSRTP